VTSIGLFTYSTKPRGSVVHACYLADALTARGHDVTLYALSKAGDRLYREVSCPVVYLPAAPAPTQPDALIAQRIQEVTDGVQRLRPRRHVYHAEDCLVASGLLALDGAYGLSPVVRTLHHWEHFESAYLQACQRRSVLGADAVAVVSEVTRRDVLRELGRSCPVIGNGVDLERFRPDAELQRKTRARYKLGSGDVVVLSVGGVEPRKNSLNSLEAMSRVLAQHPTAHWLIAGGASIWEHDGYRQEFQSRLAALPLGIRDRILQLGPVAERELTGLYQVAQILLCPSQQEGFGLCVLEALAASTAVVVSNRAPFTEYLRAEHVRFVEPESPASIADAVERLWCDAAACAALAKAGLAHAREFSWDRVAAQHEQLYGAVLERRSRGASKVHEERAHA